MARSALRLLLHGAYPTRRRPNEDTLEKDDGQVVTLTARVRTKVVVTGQHYTSRDRYTDTLSGSKLQAAGTAVTPDESARPGIS